jgi:biopolymer transport protein ExbD
MPVTANAVAMPDADAAGSVVVAVTARGAVYLDVNKVTPAELSGQVKEELAGHPGKRVFFKADARTPYATVAEALSALRTAGVNAPVLLTSQQDPVKAAYVLPKGLEVLIPPPAPDAAQSETLRIGTPPLSDAELKQRAQSGRPIVLQADDQSPFADVVHAVDICHAAGAQVYLRP